MSSDLALRVDGLGKRYFIQASDTRYRTFREALVDVVTSPLRRAGDLLRGKATGAAGLDESFWALRDVSFEIRRGEIVGIIGRNGAGKSTLLKVLSRITEPTCGRAEIYGRVGSLLEVGTGFHPELTGRENIYLNGAILGMGRSEIRRKMDEIVDFAEIEKFVDTPVKHYSSGMYLRLAFAVAAHLEPEILLIDEVLAVGDAAFQRKCLGRIGQVGGEGRTVIFVSHNMTALRSLCQRAIWLSEGSIQDDGEAAHIVSRYLQSVTSAAHERSWAVDEVAPENEWVRLVRARVGAADRGEKAEDLAIDMALDFEFELDVLAVDVRLNLSLVLYSQDDVCVLNTVSEAETYHPGRVRGVCHMPGGFLNDGTYRIRLLIVKDTSVPILDVEDVLVFELADVRRSGNWFGKWVGVVRPSLPWTVEEV